MRSNIGLVILLLFTGMSARAQTLVGNQLPIQVKVASYGATQNAPLSLPDDYNTTTTHYPLIIFLHGYGEVGNTVTALSKQLVQGLPLVISKGVKIQATSPADGKLYKFIVLSPQHHGWTTPPENIAFMLNELPKLYRVDTNRIYITGLSAGGQGVIQAVTYSQALTNKIAAIAPMSPSAPADEVLKRFAFFKEAKTAAWFFSGKTDPGNFTANARRYNDSINKYSPGASKITLYVGSHCCWIKYFDPGFREDGLNIYEWMLTHSKTGRDTAVPKPPIADRQICIGNAQDIQKIIVLLKSGKYVQYDSADMVIPNIQVELR